MPTSRLTTETAQSINDLFNANVRQIWGAGNWPDLTGWGEARFVGDLLTYPNDLSKTAYWTATNATVTANSISNPADNRVTASKVLETVTNAEHNVTQVVSAFGATTYQASVYARPAGRNYLYLAVNDGTTTFSAFFNVQTGNLGTQANVQNANVQQCANGFFLCTIVYETGANATSQTYKTGISTDGSTISYAGDITKGLYLWGNLIVQQNNVSPQQFVLPWDQTGEAEIDVLFQAWVDSPAMITYPRGQGFVVTKDGFQMISSAGGFMGASSLVRVAPNLVAMLDDADEATRKLAVQALVGLEPEDLATLALALTLRLEHPAWGTRLVALEALGWLETEALAPHADVVLAKVKDDIGHCRRAAIETIGKLGPLPQHREAVVACLSDGEWHVRRAAVMWLGRGVPLDETDPVTETLTDLAAADADERVQRAARAVLDGEVPSS